MAFAETFKALSDPVRREILQLLKNGKMSAGEIGGHFDMTGATISYHLKILKKADLVWETKVKNFVYYELNTTVVEELLLWLSDLKGGNSDESCILHSICRTAALHRGASAHQSRVVGDTSAACGYILVAAVCAAVCICVRTGTGV